ncbi:MAG TPA: pyruvate kinase [Bryobacteraceae bacterium]|nr:pyruvate kinase [Bryobacteraceae bacterium]
MKQPQMDTGVTDSITLPAIPDALGGETAMTSQGRRGASWPTHKTKLVCTIGPASRFRPVMEQMILAGMNVARLNFSHGDFSGHREVIENLRAAEHSTGRRIAIMADLPGPKMRIGNLKQEAVDLKTGSVFVLTDRDIIGDETCVSTTFPRLAQAVKPGNALYINDGLIQLEVSSVVGNDVHCRVIVGGELRSRKGLNLPDIDLGISAFTEHDYDCLKFSLESGVDAVSQSFVEKPEDILAVRQAAADLGYHPFVIAKIERSRALTSIDKIIDAADGVMIARGDLGVEMPIEQMAIIQKRVMRLANMRAKPVITATQMLESMTTNRRPTRAEATDVANAILDGTDCVMLSGESAVGAYPVEAVATLARIAAATEPFRENFGPKEMFRGIDLKDKVPAAKLIDLAVERVLEYASNAFVFVPAHNGAAVRSIARFRLPVWIIAVGFQEATCRHLQFSSGVFATYEPEAPQEWSAYSRRWLQDRGLSADLAVLAHEHSQLDSEAVYRMEIIDLRGKS